MAAWYISKIAELTASREYSEQAKELLDGIRPAVFVDTHFFNRDPEGILMYRLKLGSILDRAGSALLMP